MELQHINIKIFVEGELAVEPGVFIEVFHGWIQEKKIDQFLIDVADYRHVPKGPGVFLAGLDDDYSMDNAQGRWGLLYNRKGALGGSNKDRMDHAFACAVNACRLIESDPKCAGKVKFSRNEFELIVNDRLIAPNTDETWSATKAEIEEFLKSVAGSTESELTRPTDSRQRFGVHVKLAQPCDFEKIPSTA